MKIKNTLLSVKRGFINQKRLVYRLATILLVPFIFFNLALFVFFYDRTYPQTFVSKQYLGVVRDVEIEQKINELDMIEQPITLKYQEQTINTKLGELGISYNAQSIQDNIRNDRSWMPLINLFQQHNLQFDVKIDNQTFLDKLESLTSRYKLSPKNAKIVIEDDEFDIKGESVGHELNIEAAKEQFVSQFKSNKEFIQLPLKTLEPKIYKVDLEEDLGKLQRRQNLKINLTFGEHKFTPSSEEITNWHKESGNSYALSDQKIYAYIVSKGSEIGVSFNNTVSAISNIKGAISKQKDISFSLTKAPDTLTVSYCVAARGVSKSNLASLSSKASSVYSDSRGWSSTGKYRFQQVDSGCSFVLWLAAADQMTSFSTVCSPYWSCRVGANVIINIDRWNNASPSWNISGGNLDDYRSMVINHETGHWLGFGHFDCGGPGQLAPVMQQQSIDLQGCQFNPWPLSYELDLL